MSRTPEAVREIVTFAWERTIALRESVSRYAACPIDPFHLDLPIPRVTVAQHSSCCSTVLSVPQMGFSSFPFFPPPRAFTPKAQQSPLSLHHPPSTNANLSGPNPRSRKPNR